MRENHEIAKLKLFLVDEIVGSTKKRGKKGKNLSDRR